MTQIIVGNGNWKTNSLNTDIWKRGHIQQKFPNCPSYLSKKKPAESASLGSSDAREKIIY